MSLSAGGVAASSGSSGDEGLRASLARVQGENDKLIEKLKDLLARHKTLQKAAADLKAQAEQAAKCVALGCLCCTCRGTLSEDDVLCRHMFV